MTRLASSRIVVLTSGTAVQDGVRFASTGGDDTSGTQILWFTLREDNSDPKQRHSTAGASTVKRRPWARRRGEGSWVALVGRGGDGSDSSGKGPV